MNHAPVRTYCNMPREIKIKSLVDKVGFLNAKLSLARNNSISEFQKFQIPPPLMLTKFVAKIFMDSDDPSM